MTNNVSVLPTAAVVVAHGPTGATLTTLGRVAALLAADSPITVVAGTEPGLTALERASERGYSVVHDHGPEVLATVLDGIDGTTLVLHDDAVVSQDTVAAMMTAHADTGLIALPGTGERRQQREVTDAVLACAVGDPAALAELALRSGFGPGLQVVGEFVLAADSEMTHTGACRARLVETARSDAPPLLVAGLIVRDETENIADCLASLEGIVDRIEVADTGSLDDTAAIARSLGANVIEIEWRDDFAWARNQVMDRCRDADFMLWIDADERFECADRRRFLQVLRTFRRFYPSYRLQIRNIDNGAETHSFWAKRIVDPTGVRFEGAIHEQPRRTGGGELLEVSSALCSIDHIGYAEDVVDARGKLDRNLRIASDSFAGDPTPERAIHYARALEAASTDPVATLALVDPLLELAEGAPAPIQAMLLALRARLQLKSEDFVGAADSAGRAAELVPADAIAGAVLAEALVCLGRPGEALDRAAELATRPSLAPAIVDRVASATRTCVLFDAAKATSRLDVAMDLLKDIPAEFDPWADLGVLGGTKVLVGLAGTAGERNDERYVRALLARPDVTSDQVSDARDQFLSSGGILLDSERVDTALTDLNRVAGAPDLRRRFEDSGELTDVIAYADALATGYIDLTSELESVTEDPNAISLALGVAAESLMRRGRHEDAASDAIDAAHRWPGALRAAAIVAASATSAGMPEVALDMVAAARDTGADADASRGRRNALTNRAVDAHLAMGNLPAAVSEALEIIEQRGMLDAWPTLLEIAVDDAEKMTLVLGVALLSDGDDFLQAAAANLRPDKTAELCVAYLMSGGQNPQAVTTGILAALLRNRLDLAELAAAYADFLDEAVRKTLLGQANEAGAHDLVGMLEMPVDAMASD